MRPANAAIKKCQERKCEQPITSHAEDVQFASRDNESDNAPRDQKKFDSASQRQPARIRKQQREVLRPALPHLREAAIHPRADRIRLAKLQLVSRLLDPLR